MPRSLERLFDPRSVAVIGASQDFASISGQPLLHLKNHGYRGAIYPVNPRYTEVAGLPCYPSVAALPAVPDLALVLISAARVPDALRRCGERGIPFALVVSSGFAETGGEGVRLQQELAEIARRYDIGVVGPNCQGMMNVAGGMYAGFGAAFQIPALRAGPVSLVTQSGGFGYAVVSLAEEAGVGFRHVVCTGNEAGISTLEFVSHFIEDSHTQLVAGYVEGLKDARHLIRVGERALAANKPILLWKVGDSEPGRRAAVSHTANLGGPAELYRAAFRQCGVLEVHDVQDLSDLVRVFLYGKQPRGRGVAIVTLSGGAGVVTADQCVAFGLEVPALSAASEQRLTEIVPAFGSARNPVDVTGNIFNDPAMLREALRVVADDERVDSLIVITALVQGKMAAELAREIAELDRATAKPVVVCWSARNELAAEAYVLLDERRIPRFKTPLRACRALAGLTDFAEARRRHAARAGERVRRIESRHAREQLAATGGVLGEHAAKRLLAAYGIPVTREELVQTREQAVASARRIGFPIALKVCSADIPHKTEAGAVRLALANEAEVGAAYDEVLASACRFNPRARIDGVLVQEMVTGAIEAIAGVVNDALFGPAVMFGLGGVFAEVLRDVSFRLCPVRRGEARDMIRGVRAYPVLAGARGKAPADLDALEEALERLSALALDLEPSVAEVDVNPLFVSPKGGGVKAGDALIRTRAA